MTARQRSSGFQVSSWWGMDAVKMSLAHWQILSQVSGKNCFPTEMARFSRQLEPERASCSLSVRSDTNIISNCMATAW